MARETEDIIKNAEMGNSSGLFINTVTHISRRGTFGYHEGMQYDDESRDWGTAGRATSYGIQVDDRNQKVKKWIFI